MFKYLLDVYFYNERMYIIVCINVYLNLLKSVLTYKRVQYCIHFTVFFSFFKYNFFVVNLLIKFYLTFCLLPTLIKIF